MFTYRTSFFLFTKKWNLITGLELYSLFFKYHLLHLRCRGECWWYLMISGMKKELFLMLFDLVVSENAVFSDRVLTSAKGRAQIQNMALSFMLCLPMILQFYSSNPSKSLHKFNWIFEINITQILQITSEFKRLKTLLKKKSIDFWYSGREILSAPSIEKFVIQEPFCYFI